MTPLELVLERLQDGGLKTKRRPGGWDVQCLAHEDRNPSLSLGEGADFKVLLDCKAGCDTEIVVKALGLTMADLFTPNGHKAADPIVQTYDYHDAQGTVASQVVRKTGKNFYQRHPDGRGGWINNMDGVDRVPYRLPELIASYGAVWITEGEKDADRLRGLELTATTNPGGGSAFWAKVTETFDGLGADEIVLLVAACRSLDVVDALTAEVARTVFLVEGKDGPRANPLLKEQRLAVESLRDLLRALALPDHDDETRTTRRARTAAKARYSK